MPGCGGNPRDRPELLPSSGLWPLCRPKGGASALVHPNPTGSIFSRSRSPRRPSAGPRDRSPGITSPPLVASRRDTGVRNRPNNRSAFKRASRAGPPPETSPTRSHLEVHRPAGSRPAANIRSVAQQRAGHPWFVAIPPSKGRKVALRSQGHPPPALRTRIRCSRIRALFLERTADFGATFGLLPEHPAPAGHERGMA